MVEVFRNVTQDMNFPVMEKRVLEFWKTNDIFRKSLKQREGGPGFVFYEGPPTANGVPHPGHVLTRAMKDTIPRYRTMCGYYVERKGGWDTHGLPVELEVERELGISGKPDIEKFGVEDFIRRCKESVFKYKREWERMTERVGFWLDMDDPYVTYDNRYIESLWWALRQIWDQGLLYRGHKVVPYCPRCGTALSSHEVAQGYEEVEDPSIFVRFRLKGEENTSFLVWTTTPWTLPSNVALAVGPEYDYAVVRLLGSGEKLILARDLVDSAVEELHEVLKVVKGKELVGKEYEPLFQFKDPGGNAFRVVAGDFVVLTEGTGIVHLAPAFGEDDMRASQLYGLPVLQLVDTQGRLTEEVGPWKGMFVKDADPLIIAELERSGKLYWSARVTHTYPFCWRCESPLLYYARTSWFIKTTAIKDKLLENNQGVNWYPEHIREGRFGNFLENVIDWAVSRERYWGTPLNIWICESCGHQHCVGSVAELKGMARSLPETLELHRPYIDQAILVCPKCKGDMRRTSEVLDAWFDSGSMPFAQWHYPFENSEVFEEEFPADFICEAIDQTRGWFYTLLVNSTLLFGRAPYKNVLVLGHVLDEQGFKMSKSKGNVVDVWQIFDKQGADAMRWYLYTVNPPWSPTRFYIGAIDEVARGFLGTLWNVYAFYVLYANIDGFDPRQHSLPVAERAEMDRWIISKLNRLIGKVRERLDNYDVTGAARSIEEFVDDLSNWYVRRSRRRYWGAEMTKDKVAAYLTLHESLVTLSRLMAPFVPFISEEIYQNLERGWGEVGGAGDAPLSVHMTDYPAAEPANVDGELEERMDLARKVVYLGRASRNKVNIKNRQPLSALTVVGVSAAQMEKIASLEGIIRDELNVKRVAFAEHLGDFVAYEVKPRYDQIGPKYGKLVPKIAKALSEADPWEVVGALEECGRVALDIDRTQVTLDKEEVEVRMQDKEGYAVSCEGGLSVALHTEITDELRMEGFAREMVSKIQTMRKEARFDIADRISTRFWCGEKLRAACERHRDYIADETLSVEFLHCGELEEADARVKPILAQAGGNCYFKAWDVNGEPVVVLICKGGPA